jgi:hypothetical protein
VREARRLAQNELAERPRIVAFLTRRAGRTVTQELDASLGSVQDSGMTDATVVINGRRLRTSHDTVVAFLRQGGRAIRRARVRLSDPSGVAVEERIWFKDSTDAAGLAEEVADHIARGASGRSDLEATITVSDEG